MSKITQITRTYQHVLNVAGALQSLGIKTEISAPEGLTQEPAQEPQLVKTDNLKTENQPPATFSSVVEASSHFEMSLDDFVITEATDKVEMVSLMGEFDIVASDEPLQIPEIKEETKVETPSPELSNSVNAPKSSDSREESFDEADESEDDLLKAHLNAHRTRKQPVGYLYDLDEDEMDSRQGDTDRYRHGDYINDGTDEEEEEEEEGDWLESSSEEDEQEDSVSDWEEP